MSGSDTRKQIDSLRNILVGKIPSPEAQVKHITTGLIYKFMYDMDMKSIARKGGVRSFFVGEYEKYSWENLFDPKMSGDGKVALYNDALEAMYTNPTAPKFFTELFKGDITLPFRDPAIFNMFIEELNEFEYSNSEKLGDAYEYLLSFMESQETRGNSEPRSISPISSLRL